MPVNKFSKWFQKLRSKPRHEQVEDKLQHASSEVILNVHNPEKAESEIQLNSTRVRRTTFEPSIDHMHKSEDTLYRETGNTSDPEPDTKCSIKFSRFRPTTKTNRSVSSDYEIKQQRLVAKPITDEMGNMVSNLDLGKALACLMKEGIVARSDSESSHDTHVLKSPLGKSETSSEASNTELVVPDDYGSYPLRVPYLFVHQSKSSPVAKVDVVDEAVNTSIQDVREKVYIDDSMIKLKLKRELDDDSCTQYFALSSSIQLEPYVKARRLEEADRRLAQVNQTSETKFAPLLSDTLIEKQKGVMRLSKTSDFTIEFEEEVNQTKSDIEFPALLSSHSHDASTKELKTPELKAILETPIPKKCRCLLSTIGEVTETDNHEEQAGKSGEALLECNDLIIEDDMAQLVMVLHSFTPSSDFTDFSSSNYNLQDQSAKFMFSWNFLKNAEYHKFSMAPVVAHKEFIMNEARIYKFDMTPGVYLFLLKCPMAIELYNYVYDRRVLIGKCNLNLGECFEDISQIYNSIVQVDNKDLCLCDANLQSRQFGRLHIEFRMHGCQDQFDSCKPAKVPLMQFAPLIESQEDRTSPPGTSVLPSSISAVPSTFPRTSSGRGNVVSEAELQAFQDGLNLVLVRNKALRTTQEEITQELKDRTSWMHEELKWRLTLQENAILGGKDPEFIKWRQWKDDSTANVRYRPIAHEEFLKDGVAHIEIEILELILYDDSKPMLNDNLTHLYIELSFLNMSGKEMETLTMAKPTQDMQKIKFRFKKVFDISVGTEQAMHLSDMIRNNDSIPFTIIAQPLEHLTELHSCYDIGVASIVLFDLMQSRNNSTVDTIPVMDAYMKDVTIGQLKVRFVGVLAMRSMALHLLTPSTFKIIR